MSKSPGKIALHPIQPDLKQSHQPYDDLHERIIIPAATRRRGNKEGTLDVLGGQISEFLRRRLGFVPNPGITYHALRLCCHYHYSLPSGDYPRKQLIAQQEMIDSAYRLICAL